MASTNPELSQDTMFYISDRAVDLARVHMAVTVPLLVLTLLPLSARLHHRVRPISRFGWDDALILLGFACTITDWGLLAREMFFSPQLINYDTLTHAVKHQFLGIFFWCVAMICIKTSIALTLLRIPLEHPAWRPFLFVTIAVQTIWFIGDTIYMFVKCRPLSANWDLSISAGQCADVQTDVLVSSIGSALHVVTSLALSIAPMLVLAKLRRPLRERILVCVLTGMGIFSSVASVIKAVKVGQWRGADDEWAYAISIATWTIVEQLVAVIAACSPSLKGPIESILGRCGINLTQTSNFSFVAKSKSRSDTTKRGTRELDVEMNGNGGLQVDGHAGRSGPVVFRDGEELEDREDSTTAKRKAARKARKEARRAARDSQAMPDGTAQEWNEQGEAKGGDVHVKPEP